MIPLMAACKMDSLSLKCWKPISAGAVLSLFYLAIPGVWFVFFFFNFITFYIVALGSILEKAHWIGVFHSFMEANLYSESAASVSNISVMWSKAEILLSRSCRQVFERIQMPLLFVPLLDDFEIHLLSAKPPQGT